MSLINILDFEKNIISSLECFVSVSKQNIIRGFKENRFKWKDNIICNKKITICKNESHIHDDDIKK